MNHDHYAAPDQTPAVVLTTHLRYLTERLAETHAEQRLTAMDTLANAQTAEGAAATAAKLGARLSHMTTAVEDLRAMAADRRLTRDEVAKWCNAVLMADSEEEVSP